METEEAGLSTNKEVSTVDNSKQNTDDETMDGLFYEADVLDKYEDTSSSEKESDVDANSEIKVKSLRNQIHWSDDSSSMKHLDFTKTPGLLVPQPFSNDPIDYFSLLLDDSFLIDIVVRTNEYAIQIFAKGAMAKSCIVNWEPLTLEEFRVFLGLLLHTGTMYMDTLESYWEEDSFGLSLSEFPEHMSTNRFLQIIRALNFTECENVNETVSQNILYKVEPIIDYFNNQMRKIYYPERELCLDEPLSLWRGHPVSVYRSKNKYGCKLYTVAELNGLVVKLAVDIEDVDMQDRSHSSLVFHLLNEKFNNGHALYIDSFYNSYSLAKKLLEKETYCTGPLRVHRKRNPDFVKTKLKKGEIIGKYSQDGILIGKWKYREEFNYISTEFKNDVIQHVERGKSISQPAPMRKYDEFFLNFDREEWVCTNYPCDWVLLRWPLKIFIHILQVMLLNSFGIWKKYSGKNADFYNYRLSVIKGLLPAVIPGSRISLAATRTV